MLTGFLKTNVHERVLIEPVVHVGTMTFLHGAKEAGEVGKRTQCPAGAR